jgi:hypothetical protein
MIDRHLAAALLLTAVLQHTAAASDASTVFDMPLQQPFTVSECPYMRITKKAISYNPPASGTVCFEYQNAADQGKQQRVTHDIVSLRWFTNPHLVIANSALAVVIDGNLEGVSFNTLGIQSQQRDYEALKAKYGEPAQSNQSTLQNGYGATVAAIRAKWTIGDVLVSLDGAAGRIDSGLVRIETQKAVDERNATLAKYEHQGPSL